MKGILKIYIRSADTKQTETDSIKKFLSESGFEVLPVEFMDKNKSPIKENQIRYFREGDYLSVLEIKNLLFTEQNIEASIKYMPNLASRNRTKKGTIELWLK